MRVSCGRGSATIPAGSCALTAAPLNCRLLADFLRKTKLEFSLSVFLPETHNTKSTVARLCGRSCRASRQTQILGTSDVLDILGIGEGHPWRRFLV